MSSTDRRAGWSTSRPAAPLPGSNGDAVAVVPDEVKASISILVVDDEHTLRESCASILRSEGYKVAVCGRGDEAATRIRKKTFDIVLADLYMSQVSGMKLLELTRTEAPDTVFILMTGNPSVESSIQGLRAGAWDYIPKPFSAGHLHIVIGRAAHAVHVAREQQQPEDDRPGEDVGMGNTRLLGTSAAFRRVVELAERVAGTDASVFLTGESGTGKELVAHYIHGNSRRRTRELIPVNCAAIPENLLESEMFGHVEGAFTGAVRDKKGLLEIAHGGTLFLDELTEMPLPTQAKMLRVIQDGVVRRVGSTQTDAVVNVRFIAATNVDPAEAVREGRLRKDLHYRLRVVPIHVPPLRARGEDIPILARHFLTEFWQQHRGTDAPPPELSEDAIRTLMTWPWRGNVRELRNVMEHLAVLAGAGEPVEGSDIPFIEEDMETGDSSMSFEEVIRGSDYHTAREQVLASFEQRYLEYVVREAGGTISDAARLAGVDRTTLYRLMEKHGTSKSEILRPSED